MSIEQKVDAVRQAVDRRVSEALRRMNLDRPDIAALGNGAMVSCKVEDIRYWRDTIMALADALETSLN